MRLRGVARAHVGLDDAPPRDDRQVGVGGRERDLPARLGDASARRRALASSACARRAHARRARRSACRRSSDAGHLILRRHRRALELDAAVQRGRRDVAVDLQPRRRRAPGAAALRRAGCPAAAIADGRVLLDRAVDRLVERHALGRRRRLRDGDGTARADCAAEGRDATPRQPQLAQACSRPCARRLAPRRSLRCS